MITPACFCQASSAPRLRCSCIRPNILLVGEAAAGAVSAAANLNEDEGSVVLSVVNDAFYLNRRLLPQSTLEHRTMMAQFNEQGIDSLTLRHPVTATDVIELGLFLNGSTGDVPADGSLRLNDRPFTEADLREAATMSKLKRSYASSIDILRGVAAATSEKSFDLNPAVWAVEELLESVLREQGASLLLATLKGHDEYTFFHSVNTAILALAVGRTLELDSEKLTMLGLGALLHDIGKVRVSPAVIQYPGPADRSALEVRSSCTHKRGPRPSWLRRAMGARLRPASRSSTTPDLTFQRLSVQFEGRQRPSPVQPNCLGVRCLRRHDHPPVLQASRAANSCICNCFSERIRNPV